uniref:Uncharacterized protein n=1 Tax=Timema tahoe TaxID=61484 RepID=A0A7R9ILV6_9NEOP|nr:unnamed protein product [Timema tahoe]
MIFKFFGIFLFHNKNYEFEAKGLFFSIWELVLFVSALSFPYLQLQLECNPVVNVLSLSFPYLQLQLECNPVVNVLSLLSKNDTLVRCSILSLGDMERVCRMDKGRKEQYVLGKNKSLKGHIVFSGSYMAGLARNLGHSSRDVPDITIEGGDVQEHPLSTTV